ncbi:carbonic anhydrase [Candidatus Saccharibacteria bacterium]|nr:carbonic anhydrase [Candidatus Saccharibacteria bacterium]
MDYKKFLKSQNLRFKVLNMLSWVPDKTMVKWQYRIKTGRKLDLKNPKRYTEKLQLYKIKYRDPLMKRCANKYKVREFVESKGFGEILNELYGVYDSPDEIDFDKLPDSFVLKDTLGGGGNSVILVPDKSKLDIEKAKEKMKHWVGKESKYKNPGREWVYDNQKHQIIAEKYLICEDVNDLPDYKFFCFDGEPYFIYMMENYMKHHEEGVLGFLDTDFKLLPAHRKDFAPMKEQPKKPKNFEKMLQMAKVLSEGFPHVRVDFYDIDGKIVFGEMTFFNASGYTSFEPDEFDFELGEKFKIGGKNGS